MILVSLTNIKLILGAHLIFEDLNWSIQHDQKIGLIGPNGAGKSSLLKLITGEYSAEPGGMVTRAKGVSIGYLPQQPELPPEETAFSAALAGSPRWSELHAALEEVETEMGQPSVYNNPKALTRALERQGRYLEEYASLGGNGYPQRVRELLLGLGLDELNFDKPLGTLSGGQKKLVGLARLILARPDVLLLDEPDNHLDLAGKSFLERLIVDYPGAVVIISHDRYLLDAVVTHIAELEDGHLYIFAGDYSGYILDKETRLARQEELYQVQQREIARLELAFKRYATWVKVNDKFASRMHAIETRLARIDRMERPVLDRRRMNLELNGWRGSTKVLELCGVEKSFGLQPVLLGVNLLVRHGDRVGLIGANGAGKSVLLRLILGQDTANAGEIKLGPSITLGYYAQEHETLNPERTLIDSVRLAAPENRSMSESAAVAFLNRYLFPYQRVNQKVKELSGGERSRLQLALLVLSGANFLLLDEPTNNLDIASAEVLENALEDYEGTVLVISHDRYFLDRVVDRLLVLENGELREFPGGYSDYIQQI